MAKTKKQLKKTIKPGKDIVDSMAEDFSKKLLKAVNQGIKTLTLDFTGVEMVDSVGLGVMIAAHNSLKDKGGSLHIKNVSEDINNLLKITQLDQHFELGAVE